MDTRQTLILLKIGDIDVSQKCITSVNVERNFSDVGDKFTIDIVDTPDTNVSYDLELYMASGYRTMVLKYGDLSKDKLVAYNGTIWDYTNTFVGNIKKLTITGIMNRYIASQEGAASYTYNINWNSYFNKRADEKKPYGAISTILKSKTLGDEYAKYNTEIMELVGENDYDFSTTIVRSGQILDATWKATLLENIKEPQLTLKGPGGSIQIPIPDSFFSTTNIPPIEEIEAGTYDTKTYKEFYDLTKNKLTAPWGELSTITTTTDAGQFVEHLSYYTADRLCFPQYVTFDPKKEYVDGRISDEAFGQVCAVNFPKKGRAATKGIKKMSPYYIREDWWTYLYGEYSDVDEKYDSPNFRKKSTISPTVLKYDIPNYKEPTSEKTYKLNDTDSVKVWAAKDGEEIAFQMFRDSGTIKTHSQPFVMGGKSESFMFDNRNIQEFQGYSEFDAPEEQDYVTDAANDQTNTYYFYDKDENLRGFIIKNDDTNEATFYVQANPDGKSYGSAGLLNAGFVDISWIVKQLCTLEGWDTKDEYIVQTDYVSNCDSFIMQGQTALDFIINNLVPRSITPLGVYKVVNEDGTTEHKMIEQAQGGFYPFFDDNGYFHYQPITEKTVKDLDIDNLGYNLPNTPVISFQVNTKGTAFYTSLNVDYNPISIVTGTDFESIVTTSDSALSIIEQTKGHNDSFDAWLGITRNDVEKVYEKAASSYTANFQTAVQKELSKYDIMKEAYEKYPDMPELPNNPMTAANLYNQTTVRGYNQQQAAKRQAYYSARQMEIINNATAAFEKNNKYTSREDVAISLSQDALVNKPGTLLLGSSAYDSKDVYTRIVEARRKISETTIKATLSLWGNTDISPARNITITNMVKGGTDSGSAASSRNIYPQKHPSSGKYMILSQQDKIDASGFIQTLNLLRYTDDVRSSINKYKIDYSEAATYRDAYTAAKLIKEQINNKS